MAHITHPLPGQARQVLTPRKLVWTDPLKWLVLGWIDFKKAPVTSLAYGAVFFFACLCMAGLIYLSGSLLLVFVLIPGFMLMGPALAHGLYYTSQQLQLGRHPTFWGGLFMRGPNKADKWGAAVALLLFMLFWARVAGIIYALYPVEAEAGWRDYLPFLSIGTLTGALLAAGVFLLSAFTLPMLMDTELDLITATIYNVKAVLHNKLVMLEWGIIIFLATLAGFLTGLLGLMIFLPLIGYATWHSYQDVFGHLDR